MNKKLVIGIDNGVTGSWGVVGENTLFLKLKTRSVKKYTKKKQNVTRLDYPLMKKFLEELIEPYSKEDIIAVLERPMINAARFNASSSALRCWEATLILLEELDIPYTFIDSKEWQKQMLPLGKMGSKELKEASLQIGNRLYPQFKEYKHSDRDGILIASYWNNYGKIR